MEASAEASHKSHCDEETSRANQKEGDLEADVAKHSSRFEAAARSTTLDGEICWNSSIILEGEISLELERTLSRREGFESWTRSTGCRMRLRLMRARTRTVLSTRRRTPTRRRSSKQLLQCTLPNLKQQPIRSTILDRDFSVLQSELGVQLKKHFQLDTMRADQGRFTTTKADLEQGMSEVQKAIDTWRNYAKLRWSACCTEVHQSSNGANFSFIGCSRSTSPRFATRR